ncbi:hypothetical protein QT06_C0001G0040 [archaeon GW2011_AR15]|nr:hypothetical protein QT06_C0001G0040 [archaeon GW2011_AR15]
MAAKQINPFNKSIDGKISRTTLTALSSPNEKLKGGK